MMEAILEIPIFIGLKSYFLHHIYLRISRWNLEQGILLTHHGHLDLPVTNALLDLDRDGNEKVLPGEKYYVPGSILKTTVDQSQPSYWGPSGCKKKSSMFIYLQLFPIYRNVSKAYYLWAFM